MIGFIKSILTAISNLFKGTFGILGSLFGGLGRLLGSVSFIGKIFGAIGNLFRTKTQTGSYFLNNDDAKTYGDINYMRTSKVVKHSFPKFGSGTEGFAVSKSTSADTDVEFTGGTAAAATPSTPQPTFASNKGNFERAKVDTSMDMFRNMARNVKKQR